MRRDSKDMESTSTISKKSESNNCDEEKRFIGSGGWGTRHTLALLGFLGYVLAYSMRFNLSLAIVSMVDQPHVFRSNLQSKAANLSSLLQPEYEVCPHHQKMLESALPTQSHALDLSSEMNVAKSQIAATDPDLPSSGLQQFDWTESDQGLILGSFFWGYVVTQYPGGRFAHIYGPKWIFSIGLLLTGLVSLVLPFVTFQWGKTGLIIIRVIQGLTEGMMFPAMHVMIAYWSPPEERSRMTNMIFSGVPIGTAVTMISGGYLITYFGWPYLFYAVGIASVIWFIFWSFLIFDRPSEHPRISAKELQYIESSMQGQTETSKEHLTIPWRAIFTSLPVWAIMLAHIGNTWGHYLLHTEVPKYLHTVHGFKMEHNGWFSALPQLLNFGVCITMSNLSDFLIVSGMTSVLFTRKLCGTIALWGSAAAFLGIIFGGCNTVIAIICLNIAGGVLGAGVGAWLVNIIDISPNQAGTIMGVANSFANCLGFVAPYVSGLILHGNPSLLGWKIVFLIPAGINLSVSIFYLIYANANEMSWNRGPTVIHKA